ncbi:LCP family protein [Salinicoccus sp. HZC-1]|uniref:LCP family glycopolymer transferase n=1 Tax=Salinicoccus sp. HZC-1 TaxID=3385497 RepID=UPI00398BA17A
MKRTENKKGMHPVLKILLVLLIVSVIIIAGVFAYVYFQLKGAVGDMNNPGQDNQTGEKIELEDTASNLRDSEIDLGNGDPVSVVLFGTDSDSERDAKGMGQRSDTIMVVTLNPANEEGRIVSIPRDTRTEIVGRDTTEKINHAYAYGGPVMAKDTVENFLDTPIDYYVSVNMDGLETIVDAVGGITVTSEDTFDQSGYSFVAGQTYEMDGEQALAFSRSRKSAGAGGDSGRQMRQQQVVQAISEEMLSLQTITNFNEILGVLRKNVSTNIPLGELNAIRSNYQEPAQNIERLTLEGVDDRGSDGLWYFYPNDESYSNVRNELRQNLELDE